MRFDYASIVLVMNKQVSAFNLDCSLPRGLSIKLNNELAAVTNQAARFTNSKSPCGIDDFVAMTPTVIP
jgi:hypothetical protein